jgi:hypothetical protein
MHIVDTVGTSKAIFGGVQQKLSTQLLCWHLFAHDNLGDIMAVIPSPVY